jgi:GxxExxY protein
MDLEKVASGIVDSAYNVHKTLGPGLLESAYQAALSYELVQKGDKKKLNHKGHKGHEESRIVIASEKTYAIITYSFLL